MIAETVVKQATAAQRRAADPRASVWVAASAGRGKTTVLTDRVLSLLLDGTAPGRILCLTFTKAAAAEMSNRLTASLAEWSVASDKKLAEDLTDLLGATVDSPRLATARRLFATVLDTPGGMKIQTIHAFCQSLLGRFPLEAGIAPHAQVLDERGAAELLQEARIEVLAAGDADPQTAENIAKVTMHAHEDSFTELLQGLIRERAHLQRMLRTHGGIEGIVTAVYAALDVAENDDPAELIAAACADEACDTTALRRVAVAMLEGDKKDQARAPLVLAWLEDPDERPARFDSYLQAFFTKNGRGSQFSKLIHAKALKIENDGMDVLGAEAARLETLRNRLNGLTVAGSTAALLSLGAQVLERYEARKAAQAVLDYDDLILITRDLLLRPGVASWVLYKLDGGLDHVLVDEAQDTNPEQWQVIQALTAEFFAGEGARELQRTVFAVGDAKQSIFSFQRADPTEFTRMQAHFAERTQNAGLNWQKVDLGVSFRSTAAVLRAVDAVFAPQEVHEGVLFGETGMRHLPVRLGQAGRVELWPLAEPEESESQDPWSLPLASRQDASPSARLARLIAERIRRWTLDRAAADDPESRLEAKARRLRPGDFLVLVRRRTAFVDELVRALKDCEVPVAGVDRMVLTEQLAVMDLVALGRVLLLPEDDLTLATVLKGPLIGLSETQLFDLAYNRQGSLWEALVHRRDAGPHLVAARKRLSELLARVDFVPPYELFAEILGPGGGRESLLRRLGPEAIDPIEEFLSLALAYEQDHVPSLEGFLHWLELGEQQVKRDMEHGNDVVRIMTVHGAKGLQAPVVFLPDTAQTPQPPKGLLWPRKLSGLALWPLKREYDLPLTMEARAAAQRAQDEEYRRLLYVAMTRAEDRLYVCGWRGARAPSQNSWYKLVETALASEGEEVEFDFGALRPGGWQGQGYRLYSTQSAAAESPEGAITEPHGQAELPDWAKRVAPAEPTPPRPLAPSRPSAPEPTVRSPLGSDEGRRYRRGRLIHRLLQSLPELPGEARAAAAARFLQRRLLGLTAEEQNEIRETTLAVVTDARFAALFGPMSRAEVPLTGVIDGRLGPQVVSGQVDRLLVVKDRILAVDYKTNRPAPREEAEVPAVYLRQMAAYRALLLEVYPGKTVDCLLLWTDGPRLMQLSNALLEHHAP